MVKEPDTVNFSFILSICLLFLGWFYPSLQVVLYLNYMLDGNTLCTMGDFSPPNSDSVNSSADSSGSQGGNGTIENAEANSETTNIQDKGLILLTPKQTETNVGKIISTPTHSGQPNQKSIEKKVKVPYEEMVI